jgi:hypothetical protein
MMLSSATCTDVCSARSVIGRSTPFSAFLEIRVTEMAHVEWKRMVAAIFMREGGAGGSGVDMVNERLAIHSITEWVVVVVLVVVWSCRRADVEGERKGSGGIGSSWTARGRGGRTNLELVLQMILVGSFDKHKWRFIRRDVAVLLEGKLLQHLRMKSPRRGPLKSQREAAITTKGIFRRLDAKLW